MTRDQIDALWHRAMRDAIAEGEQMTRYHFAALVISHHVKENRPKPNATERERLQQIAYQHGGIGDLCRTELEFGAMVAAAEREACAQLCEAEAEKWEGDDGPISTEARLCALAIRARGTNV